jgi:Zn-dependent M28 family amino/carboxypeptidase
MMRFSSVFSRVAPCVLVILCGLAGCKAKGTEGTAPKSDPAPIMASLAEAPPQVATDALSAEKTGGFDGKLAYNHVAKQVSYGPRPSGSTAIQLTQDYILAELKSSGCTVETDDFSADTPVARIPMKNIVVKIPGARPGIILLATHYDTLKKENFVGADDAGSSTGVMLELARQLCPKRGRYAVWIAFFDGEEAVQVWSDTDSRYGSRQMAAKLAVSGELKNVRAMLLADIVGGKTARIKRDAPSTKALTDLIWTTAKRLGYGELFVDQLGSSDDDHDSFLNRNVPAVDVIADFTANGYWHTAQDTMDKISAKTLGMVGHVFLETVKELQAK